MAAGRLISTRSAFWTAEEIRLSWRRAPRSMCLCIYNMLCIHILYTAKGIECITQFPAAREGMRRLAYNYIHDTRRAHIYCARTSLIGPLKRYRCEMIVACLKNRYNSM